MYQVELLLLRVISIFFLLIHRFVVISYLMQIHVSMKEKSKENELTKMGSNALANTHLVGIKSYSFCKIGGFGFLMSNLFPILD